MALTHALILETRRDASRNPGDPRFAGAIIERRLRDQLDVVVWRSTFIEDDKGLEDQSNPLDAVIRRKIVACIDNAVRQVVEKRFCSRIVVAATGGIPAIATLVREVVLLHASTGPTVELVEIADGTKARPPARDRAVPLRSSPEPAESFRVRRYALDLIERGNFLGAWGAVRHFHGDETEHRWPRVVKWLSLFAASLPIRDECDIHVLRHERMAERAAIRVELAAL